MSTFLAKMLGAFLHHAMIGMAVHEVLILCLLYISIIGLDVVPVANFVLFYHVYLRIQDLRVKFERGEIAVEQLQAAYKAVANALERLHSKYDAIVSIIHIFSS